mgnify:CR=1 FL=1
MQKLSLEQELKENAYPGRGIVIGKSPDGKFAVTAYFIMGRSENSRTSINASQKLGMELHNIVINSQMRSGSLSARSAQ